MMRNILNAFVLVMLILQGVAQASVDVQPHSYLRVSAAGSRLASVR
jgi:hypothetical protein